jgi:dTDP-4-dehydrorhamnose reductase
MVTKKVLILGATGILGSEIRYQLSKLYGVDITASVRGSTSLSAYSQSNSIEILEFDALNFINSPNAYVFDDYDVVINAIGAIKQRSISKDNLYLLNAEFPKILAKKIIDSKARLIHFTTDCVFQGNRDNLKTESTPHDAIDDYGRSKSIGEVSQHNFWNFRASFIGAESNSNLSLLNWFLNQKNGASINGFTNHIWNGITVVHYAMIISKIVEHYAFPESRVLHLIPADEITKYDLLKMLGRYFDREDIIVNYYSESENVFRKIDTNFSAQNLELWNLIGRVKLPYIEELIAELALEYKFRSYYIGNQFRRTD